MSFTELGSMARGMGVPSIARTYKLFVSSANGNGGGVDNDGGAVCIYCYK